LRAFKSKKTQLLGSVTVILAFAVLVVWGGNLEPPGPPGSTMRTLDEIYDLLSSIFERQEAGVSGEGLAAEPRLIGCMHVNDGEYTSGDPNDLADPICGDVSEYDPPWTRVIAGTQSITQDFDAASGQTAGTFLVEPFVVTKNINRGSVFLFKNMVQNTSIPDVTVEWYRDDGKGTHEHYATVLLSDARILDLRQQQIPTAGGNFLHVEDVAFGYQTITWTYEPGGVTHSWSPGP